MSRSNNMIDEPNISLKHTAVDSFSDLTVKVPRLQDFGSRLRNEDLGGRHALNRCEELLPVHLLVSSHHCNSTCFALTKDPGFQTHLPEEAYRQQSSK